MKVVYCDLCGSPIKQIKYLLKYFKYHVNEETDSPSRFNSFSSSEKEICETCKEMIDNIFKLRMEGILKLAKDLKTIYQMPVKNKKYKRKK